MDDFSEAEQSRLPTESLGWNGLQTLRASLSGRVARYTEAGRPKAGLPRRRPRKAHNDALIFEIDLTDVFRSAPGTAPGYSGGLTENDFEEMNLTAISLLGSLDAMVNKELWSHLGDLSDIGSHASSPLAGFKSLYAMATFLARHDDASTTSSEAQQKFGLTTGPRPLFAFPEGDAGTLAIGKLRKWKTFMDELMPERKPQEQSSISNFDGSQFSTQASTDRENFEKSASIMVNAIFQEFRQLSCAGEATHEIRLHVSDELYNSRAGRQPNLDMFVSCCPGESLFWQSAELGAFETMLDGAKQSICTAIQHAMERRRRLRLSVRPQGIFDVTDRVKSIPLRTDNFDGESLSDLLGQGVFNRIEVKDYLNQTAKSKVNFETKARIALGLSRCLMDFFDEGLELAEHSWVSNNVHFRLATNQTQRNLYVSLRPNAVEDEEPDFINMFKNGNPVLLSFAKLLLEVLGGSEISIQISPIEEENVQNWLDLCGIIDGLDPRDFSPEYLRVVKACLDLWKRLQQFDKRDDVAAARGAVRQAMYEEIVQRLELLVNPQSKKKRRASTLDFPSPKRVSVAGLSLNDSPFKIQRRDSGRFLKDQLLFEEPSNANMTERHEDQTMQDEKDTRRATGSIDDLEGDYAALSLYDEQDEEHTSNRKKAEEYFAHLDTVTTKYIKPLMKYPVGRLPVKQRRLIRIAIVDSGIDMSDPFIMGKLGQVKGQRNWTDSDPDNCHDNYGHGTNVARLVLKVAPAVEVFVAKVSTGRKMTKKNIARISEAMEWATAVWKVDIISMSLGLDGTDERLQRSLDRALNQANKIVVAAAANWGGNHAIAFPGCHKGVICIHSTDGHGNPSSSNPTVQRGMNFAVLGQSIKSSTKRKVDGEMRREAAYISGTSYATAIAAGIQANILEFSRHTPWSEGEREMLYSSYGMQRILQEVGQERKEHHYILPWKLFDGRPKEDIWADIRDVIRGRR